MQEAICGEIGLFTSLFIHETRTREMSPFKTTTTTTKTPVRSTTFYLFLQFTVLFLIITYCWCNCGGAVERLGVRPASDASGQYQHGVDGGHVLDPIG